MRNRFISAYVILMINSSYYAFHNAHLYDK